MDSKVSKLITKSAWLAIAIFVIRYLMGNIEPLSFLKCETWYDYLGAAGESISIAALIMALYDKWLWSINPLDSTPRLKGSYTGKLIYDRDKIKNIRVDITQTSLKVAVKITTNEITSNTITSDLIKENGEYVLYYTYLTNPSSQFSEQNPIQHGTCRLVQTDANTLQGQYWTSRRTIGDIELTREQTTA